MFGDVVIVFVITSTSYWRSIGGSSWSSSTSVTFPCLSSDPGGGLFHFIELFYELVQLRLRAEAEAIDRVGPDIGPLAKLLTGFGERHVGGDGGVDDRLGALHGDDPVQGPGGVVEEGHGHGCTGGRYP